MKIRSFAKINLGLEILGKRADHYHDILTLFQSIDFWDDLEFRPARGGDIVLEGDDPSIPWDESNLIFKAARMLQEASGVCRGARIRVRKRIPGGKGLGGGSGNAAAALYALNRLWNLGFSRPRLQKIGRDLGSDVPYFLKGGLCLGSERGDRLTDLAELPPSWCVLALPDFPVSTAEIYGKFPSSLTSEGKDSKIMRFLETKNFGLLENRLEQTIFRSYPQLVRFKSFFQDHSAELSLVSGTGSAVFGLFSEREKAFRAKAELGGSVNAVLAKTLSRRSYWARLRAGASPSW